MRVFRYIWAGVFAVSTSVSATQAATVTVESAFLVEIEAEATEFVDFSFEPFVGDPGDLSEVIFELQSTFVPTAIAGGTQAFIGMTAASAVLGQGVDDSTTMIDGVVELLGAGFDANLFTDGPVTFFAGIAADEGVSTGLWFAGTVPSGGGGGGFVGAPLDPGFVTLTYVVDDGQDGGGVEVVPLPGALSFMLAGLAVLGCARRRGLRGTV